MTLKKTIVLVVVAVVLIAAVVWLKRQIDIDRCLDNGGRWNYELGDCETSAKK